MTRRVLSFVLLLPGLAAPSDLDFFETKVRPVLAANCYACHSANARIAQAGLRVDHRAGVLAAVKPGDPANSRLIQAVRHEVKPTMPPSGKLKAEEIEALEEWVRRGAPWPNEADPAAARAKAEAGPDPEKHWAWQPVNRRHEFNGVDGFIDAKLREKSIAPNPAAKRETLLRRLYFDLIGLPPPPDAVDAFTPESYERAVDELLASPEFAERWGRHWLDITYYGDTMDANAGIPAAHAWRYRDYVIQSFHSDKPINRFIVEQIAGDVLPEKIPEATGYLALGPWALVQADKVQLKADVTDQQIDAIGKGLLGLTLGCARCHDHKFDPVSQREYFGLAGILNSTRTVHGRWREAGVFSDINKVALAETAEQATLREARAAEFEQALAEVRARIASVEEEKKATEPDRVKELDAMLQRLRRREGMLVFNLPRPPVAYAVEDEERPGDSRIQIRGNAHQLGDQTPRTFLRIAMWGADTPPLTGSGRLELARWIADDCNPLTARLYANRVWQQLFGVGLVKSADNFGLRGETPSHPELLDYLAGTFMADGWSTKKLVRRLVLSRAYRRSSEPNPAAAAADPDNRLLARMNPRRLEAEAVRDAVLAITGQLDPRRGGQTLPTDDLNTFAPDLGKVNPPRMISSGRLPDRIRNRRTVYMPVYRQAQMNDLDVLNLFDFANNSEVTASRRATVVPTQALFLMNSPWIREQAGEMARRLLNDEFLLDHERARRIIERIYNRPAGKEEIERALGFVYEMEQALTGEKGLSPAREAWARLIHSLFASNEFLFRS
jgi:cytochrome c553